MKLDETVKKNIARIRAESNDEVILLLCDTIEALARRDERATVVLNKNGIKIETVDT